jgi:hypothetical protein
LCWFTLITVLMLLQVFSALYDRKDLLVNHDRYGLFRAIKKKPEHLKEDWQTMENLHLDMNPWR